MPGRPIGDGPDGHSLWPSFVNIPCEYLESYYPLRIERWETVADTGGAGLHRGGNAVDVAYRFLEAGTIAIHDDRWLTYPWGVNGGEPGARSRKWLERADGSTEMLSSKVHDVPVKPGDLLHFVTWGGGGWGDPLARDPELVGLEVRRGLVTAEGGRRYGVVCDDSGQVDAAATTSLRAELSQGRPDPLPTFDMGPGLETILERCEAETGLPAPRPPVAL
ncbi:hydantoinase B/oxoprolinase family protein [Nocardioides mesophilus]|uniref:hydantoinase B/oxoprolinase family protein n=1 Tax=Nocardioides mesophilus TaxID=433659 RepID=UPI003CCD4634